MRYKERNAEKLDEAGNYYCTHVSAMTGEGLHSKAAIAAELGYRDMQINKLRPLLKDMVCGADHNAALVELGLAIIADTLGE